MNEHRISIHGEIDLDNAKRLRAALNDAIRNSSGHVIVDCTNLTFIDSTGVTVLLEASAKLEADQRHLAITNAHDTPRLVFEALGLSDLLHHELDTQQRFSDQVKDQTVTNRHAGRREEQTSDAG